MADRRFNALLGRDDDDDDQHGETDQDGGETGGEQLPDTFSDADDDWLVGLGYSPCAARASGWTSTPASS